MQPLPDDPMLDSVDVELLNLLQDDADRTTETLANEVALPASGVRRRLRRMRESGIIAGAVAVLHPKFRSERISALALVRLADAAAPGAARDLCRKLAPAREVTYCGRGSGPWHVVVQLLVRSSELLQEFVARELEESKSVEEVTIVVLADATKSTSKVPLDRADHQHWMM